MVRQTLGPEIRQETALASVAQEAAELTSRTGAVMGVIVRKREAEIEMIALRRGGRIMARKCDEMSSYYLSDRNNKQFKPELVLPEDRRPPNSLRNVFVWNHRKFL